ncbi:hypothetical protein MKX03_015147, partial [Papaver bracteatum]
SVFGGSEKLDHSISPEIGVHSFPVDNFLRSGSDGVNLLPFSAVDLNEPALSNWNSTTNIKFEVDVFYVYVSPVNDDGRSITRDLDGFPATCRKTQMMKKNRYRDAYDLYIYLQIEQGVPIFSKWLIFNRFKFVASKGVKDGPVLLLASRNWKIMSHCLFFLCAEFQVTYCYLLDSSNDTSSVCFTTNKYLERGRKGLHWCFNWSYKKRKRVGSIQKKMPPWLRFLMLLPSFILKVLFIVTSNQR